MRVSPRNSQEIIVRIWFSTSLMALKCLSPMYSLVSTETLTHQVLLNMLPSVCSVSLPPLWEVEKCFCLSQMLQGLKIIIDDKSPSQRVRAHIHWPEWEGSAGLEEGGKWKQGLFCYQGSGLGGKSVAMPIVKAVGAAMIARREGVEGEHPKAPTLQNLSLFPQRPRGEGSCNQRQQGAVWDVSSAVWGINPVDINQKCSAAFRTLSFGNFEINQNRITLPRLLQAYTCLKCLLLESKAESPFILFFFFSCHAVLIFSHFRCFRFFPSHTFLSFLLPPGCPLNVKSQEHGNIKHWFVSL